MIIKNIKKITLIFTILSTFDAIAQNLALEKTVNIDKKDDKIEGSELSSSNIKNAIDEIFSSKKLKSLMYNEEEFGNIENAIEALRNNQEFTPQGEEYTKKNEADIKKQDEELKKLQESEDNVKSYIYLSSIMFFGENNWSLWINEKKYTHKTNLESEELSFKNITQDQVTILWKLSISKWKILSGKRSEELAPKINSNNQVEVEFTIKPNQTFILSGNKIVNGRAIDMLKKK